MFAAAGAPVAPFGSEIDVFEYLLGRATTGLNHL
jgi:hypothetical protein